MSKERIILYLKLLKINNFVILIILNTTVNSKRVYGGINDTTVYKNYLNKTIVHTMIFMEMHI